MEGGPCRRTELNSVLRIAGRVRQIRGDLGKADDAGVALGLAKDKLVGSPGANKNFKRAVAKRVDFGSQEKLFGQLASLDLTDVGAMRKPDGKPVAVQKPDGKRRDPEPNLSDFHEPFGGRESAHVKDEREMRALVDAAYRKVADWPDEFLRRRKKVHEKYYSF